MSGSHFPFHSARRNHDSRTKGSNAGFIASVNLVPEVVNHVKTHVEMHTHAHTHMHTDTNTLGIFLTLPAVQY